MGNSQLHVNIGAHVTLLCGILAGVSGNVNGQLIMTGTGGDTLPSSR